MAERTRTRSALVSLALCLALAGCGSTYSGISDHAAPPASDFPKAENKSLTDILRQAGGESELVVLPTGLVFDKGRDRYGFGVFTPGKKQVVDAQVAIYFAHGADGKALGPYPARVESLATKSEFVAQTTGQDPQAAKVVYVVEGAPLTMNGEWRVLALVRDGGSLAGTFLPSAVVGHYPGSRPGFPKSPANPPDVGQPAPRIHTPTAAEVGGDLSKIDTRIPPDDMEEFDFADVLGKKPVVLVFATPQFCQSRVCGPVVDPAKGVRPQVRAFNLPSEPWTFVIDRHGIIRTRIEGALSVAELENAVREVTG